nr:hypothetical protein [Lentinula edodes]
MIVFRYVGVKIKILTPWEIRVFFYLFFTTTNFMKFLKRMFSNPVIIVLNNYFNTKTKLFKVINIFSIYLVNIFKYIILFLILSNILLFLFDIFSYFDYLWMKDLVSYVIPSGESSSSGNVDPVRWWPSGVPQGWTIIGTGLATLAALSKMPGVSPRMRVLGALGASGVSAGSVTYHSAIEKPVGFNRFMWSLSKYQKTGEWPSIEQANQVSQTSMDSFIKDSMKHVDGQVVDSVVSEVANKKNLLPSSNFDFSDFITRLSDLIFSESMKLLKPVYVEGFFDDLIGQRMFVEVILLIFAISIVFLFIVFLFNVIFLLNKDRIIKKFDNKFISLYVKYQSFFSKLTLLYIPIFIFIGLFGLCHGLHWLITNQIPYESLEIDLHKFVSSSYVSFILLKSNKFNIRNNKKLLYPQVNNLEGGYLINTIFKRYVWMEKSTLFQFCCNKTQTDLQYHKNFKI